MLLPPFLKWTRMLQAIKSFNYFVENIRNSNLGYVTACICLNKNSGCNVLIQL